jgi:hypothetical protein
VAREYRRGGCDGLAPMLLAERAARLALELAAQVADSRSQPGIAAAIRGTVDYNAATFERSRPFDVLPTIDCRLGAMPAGKTERMAPDDRPDCEGAARAAPRR